MGKDKGQSKSVTAKTKAAKVKKAKRPSKLAAILNKMSGGS